MIVRRLMRCLRSSLLIPFQPVRVVSSSGGGYFVVFPEVPETTAERNPFMKAVQDNRLPPFKDVTLSDCIDGCAKIALEFEAWINDLCDTLEDRGRERTVALIVDSVEARLISVNYAWSIFRQLAATCHYGDRIKSRLLGMQRLINRVRSHRFLSQVYFTSLKELAAQKGTPPCQTRLIDRYLSECEQFGVDLNPNEKATFEACQSLIFDHEVKFKFNQQVTTYGQRHTIANVIDISEAPDHILWLWSKNEQDFRSGPFEIFYVAHSYWPFMRYCSQRLRRYSVWQAWNARAGFKEHFAPYNNSSHIEELRINRDKLAKLFGHESYFEMRTSEAMAGSAKRVFSLISSVYEPAANKFSAQLAEMEAMGQQAGAIKDSIKAWDVDFYARKLAERKYKVKFNAVAEFFPFEATLSSVLALVETLFGIQFTDVTAQTHTWQPEVRVYKVVEESGALLGHLFLDPFTRQKKIPMVISECGKNRSQDSGSAVVFLNLNLMAADPTHDVLSLFHWDQLKDFFRELGKCLQILMSNSPYAELAGLNGVEFDCADVCSFVFEKLFMNPTMIRGFSGHHSSGEQLSEEAAKAFCNGIIEMNLPAFMRDLFYSELDYYLYVAKSPFWFDLYRKLSESYFPFPADKNDNAPCSYTPLIDSQTAAGHYKTLWSEMVASNLLSSVDFENNESVNHFCQRFRKLYLASDGCRSQLEIFREFSGGQEFPTTAPMIASRRL